jgi:hypothetical protein
MQGSPRYRNRAPLAAVLISIAIGGGALMVPRLAWTWGSQTHRYIARNYSQHLPAQIDGLRAYDAFVEQHVNDPDIRRPSTPGESYRHYIDIDRYPEFFAGTLPHDRAALEAIYGASFVLDTGIVPWAVGEVVTTLTQQFAAQQWSAAATTIADLCHYVGDASQPLHCTENYDGQLTGNSGIHSRYESTMMNGHIGDLHTSPAATTYSANVVDAMFDLIGVSWTGVAPILDADDDARAASGGSYNSTYYASLWTDTEVLSRGRVDVATIATASFVYTAWVDAGQPTVPGSSVDVVPAPRALARLEAWPLPFRTALSIRFEGIGPLTVDVFDVRGARVARVVDRAPGAGVVSWSPGNQVDAGVYFLRLITPDRSIVRRVMLLD